MMRLRGLIFDYAIAALKVLNVVLMLLFAVLLFTSNITPLGAGVMGLAACTLVVGWKVLQRKRRWLMLGEQ